jgi:hypothetical protein
VFDSMVYVSPSMDGSRTDSAGLIFGPRQVPEGTRPRRSSTPSTITTVVMDGDDASRKYLEKGNELRTRQGQTELRHMQAGTGIRGLPLQGPQTAETGLHADNGPVQAASGKTVCVLRCESGYGDRPPREWTGIHFQRQPCSEQLPAVLWHMQQNQGDLRTSLLDGSHRENVSPRAEEKDGEAASGSCGIGRRHGKQSLQEMHSTV